MFVEPEVGLSYPSIFNLGEINSYQLNALLSRLGKKKKNNNIKVTFYLKF